MFVSTIFYLTVNSALILALSPCSTQGVPSHPFDESRKYSVSPKTDLIGLSEFGVHFVHFFIFVFSVMNSLG